MMPVIFVLCHLGSYSISSRLFDVWVLLGCRHRSISHAPFGYPIARSCSVLGVGDILDKNLAPRPWCEAERRLLPPL